MVTSTANTHVRRVEVAVENGDSTEFWLAEVATRRLHRGATLELDEGSYEITCFGASGIVGAETRVFCRPLRVSR